jgi:hypothetical protein
VADRVTFTKGSAERIAQVVRIVEAGNRDTGGLPTSPRFGGGGGSAIKFCTWAADWYAGETATITFDPATNVTATAVNVVLGFGPGNGWVAKKGTAGWHLIGADLTLQPGYVATDIQLFGHSTSSALAQWYSITTCATATA